MRLKSFRKQKFLGVVLLLTISGLIILSAIMIGSAGISLEDTWRILMSRVFLIPLPEKVESIAVTILTKIRIPRVFMAFLTGMALGISGCVMQSVLRNPLASSFTLGVSSGASLGASLVMLSGITIFSSTIAMSLGGFLFGVLTVLLILFVSARFNPNLENQTIILVGMILSLFLNSILTVLMTFSPDYMQRIIFWQLGSFSGASKGNVELLCLAVVLALLLLLFYHHELDMLTFGEEDAMSVGVEVKVAKMKLMIIATFLTGVSVSLVGVIGFIDLIAPHMVRKFFGSLHRWVLPTAALLGGILCVAADVIARTVLAPRELPIGAVCALIGAPFFAYVYFGRLRGEK